MTGQGDGAALRVAKDYYEAWTGGDLDRALTFVADDLVCEAPPGRLDGKAAFRAFMAPFVGMLVTAKLYAAYGDDDTAVLMYDTETTLVARAPAAEYLTVRDGQIVHSVFVFDRAPFDAARKARQA